MRYFSNDIANFSCEEDVLLLIINMCKLVKKYPFILEPFRGENEKVRKILSNHGFQLYSTVKKTTLVYNNVTNIFLKILHPLTVRKKVFSLFTDRARSIYILYLELLNLGIKVPKIIAYGTFKKNKTPFFAMEKINGKSLHDILIREKGAISEDLYNKIIKEIAYFHKTGYWFGDAHLSHIFIDQKEVSGFIDIDSIRRNKPFRLKNLAKDLAGLNPPNLPITLRQKTDLLQIYMEILNIPDEKQFLQMIKYYSKKRWR